MSAQFWHQIGNAFFNLSIWKILITQSRPRDEEPETQAHLCSLGHVQWGRKTCSESANFIELTVCEKQLCIFITDLFPNGPGPWLIRRYFRPFLFQRNCYCREYTSGSPARFISWLWSKNKRKVDADAREEQNWYSMLLFVHSNHGSNFFVKFLMYIL